ncbi:class I SAM-dependent methyltransferase [Dyella ginsengisoli]|uniref:Class I SAM-dependent methyltransferase n=1 Tax=Dyella ginsengisoli TaxID=363848 RepID=A0ABW8JSH1_9GAMM
MTAPSTRLDVLERDASLREPGRLRERSDALDWLDTCLALGVSAAGDDAVLRQRIEALAAELQAVDDALSAQIRQAIRRGEGAQALRAWMAAAASGPDADDSSDRYDHLDNLISGVLAIRESPGPITPLDQGMVFYQPTPARHIFDALTRLALDEHDVLVDLGSGMGHVPLLAAICSPARCIGVEWQEAYVASARRCAQELGLVRAAFVQGDARQADLSSGTVFYLYTPFDGDMLHVMLDRVAAEARSRPIRLCTLGPCTERVARESWLRPVGACRPDRPAIFHGR